ncbi:MAG TPA: DNA repair protein RecO [Phycisphaerales bacterium]|nr:DNA repair protein RecO [Phycisphaerales bacterium]HMP36059.1 DNA repair protein RecO [Phycisphaerales bacterium]
MPTLTDEAICVRHWDFSETSQTVSLLTRGHGLLRGLAKGAKRERARFSGGIDLLARGRVIALTKPGRELATLTDWDLLEAHRHLRESLGANSAGFYMAELACRLVAEGESRPRSYDAFAAGLRALADRELLDATLVRFQWTLLEEGGVRPTLDPDDGSMPPPATGSDVADAEEGAPSVQQGDERRESSATSRERSPGSGGPSGVEGASPSTAERSPLVVIFAPHEGGVIAGPGRAAPRPAGASRRWRVRLETIDVLRRLEREGVVAPASGPAVRRAGRLLAACLRELIGQEPVTLRSVYGAIPT